MKRVLVTGSGGFLGSHIARALEFHGFIVIKTSRHEIDSSSQHSRDEIVSIDLADASFIGLVDRVSPDAIVHTAAMADIRTCEHQPDLARRINVEATQLLAQWCAERGARFIFISTDQVFDGGRSWSREDDPANPIHVYGQSKFEAEAAIDTLNSRSTIARLSLVYGHSPGRRSASEQIVGALRAGERPKLFTDEYRTPIFVEDVASAIVELLHAAKALPIIHLAGPDRVSRFEFGLAVAGAFGLDASQIDGLRQDEVDLQPPRPKDLSLDTSLARRLLRTPLRPVHAGLYALATQRMA